VQVRIRPAHDRLDDGVQLVELDAARHDKAAPDAGLDVTERDLQFHGLAGWTGGLRRRTIFQFDHDKFSSRGRPRSSTAKTLFTANNEGYKGRLRTLDPSVDGDSCRVCHEWSQQMSPR
jgi:hypothetical protein